jgi:tRNA uridine 5-carboxymethylaminomethyl modification enzyme
VMLNVAANRDDHEQVGLAWPADGTQRTRGDLVAGGVGLDQLLALDAGFDAIPTDIVTEAIEDARYAPYIARHDAELRALAANEAVLLDPSLDYRTIGGLSNEMVERLDRARPETLGQAARIAGVTPAALTAIMVHSRRSAA